MFPHIIAPLLAALTLSVGTLAAPTYSSSNATDIAGTGSLYSRDIAWCTTEDYERYDVRIGYWGNGKPRPTKGGVAVCQGGPTGRFLGISRSALAGVEITVPHEGGESIVSLFQPPPVRPLQSVSPMTLLPLILVADG